MAYCTALQKQGVIPQKRGPILAHHKVVHVQLLIGTQQQCLTRYFSEDKLTGLHPSGEADKSSSVPFSSERNPNNDAAFVVPSETL